MLPLRRLICMVPLRQSMSSQRRSISSLTRKPCRNVTSATHVVTVTVAVALEGSEQPVQFVLGQMLTGPVIPVSLTPLDFPHYMPIGRLPGDDIHWLFSAVSLATFHIIP
jgi:hypothetical protein